MEDALARVRSYAAGYICRQASLVQHFTGDDVNLYCNICDVCESPDEVMVDEDPRPARREAQDLPPDALDTIVSAVGGLRRPVGKTKIAKALRGSRAKALSRYGLTKLPEHGALKSYEEPDIVRAIDALLDEGRLVRKGRKYPTVWLAGRPVRQPRDPNAPARASRRPRYTPMVRALDNYRRRTARRLKWKPYMVFQRRVILAIDRQRPESLEDLARIPGLGEAKIARFGHDLLELIREHSG